MVLKKTEGTYLKLEILGEDLNGMVNMVKIQASGLRA